MQLTASFRDPSGSCCLVDGRVLRRIRQDSAPGFEAFLESATARSRCERGELVHTRRLAEGEVAPLRASSKLENFFAGNGSNVYFEHERIFFPSYPYEWPPEMLWEAGRLTLELARGGLADGYGLKDATPYNVLFRGCRP